MLAGPCYHRPPNDHQEQGPVPLQLLWQEPGAGPQAHRGPGRVHLRRVHQPLPGDHRGGDARDAPRLEGGGDSSSQPAQDQGPARRVRHQPGAGQEGPLGGGLQPLQARQRRPHRRRRRARQEQRPPRRPHRLRQDAAGADAGQGARRAVLHRRCDQPDRGRLRRGGRREHPPAPHPGRRLRRAARPARDHLHRRDRQDRAQDRQPVDHPRRLGRGRAAGAAQDPGGNGRQRAAAGRSQAPAPGLHPDRHHQHPLHLRRRVRGPGEDHRGAGRRSAASASARRRATRRRSDARPSSTSSCRRTCSSTG